MSVYNTKSIRFMIIKLPILDHILSFQLSSSYLPLFGNGFTYPDAFISHKLGCHMLAIQGYIEEAYDYHLWNDNLKVRI